MVNKGIKLRIYPNNKQKTHIARTCGCCRLVYNKYLALKKDTYKETGKGVSYKETSKDLTAFKKSEEFAFLNEVSGVALQQALRDLDTAYQRFFKHLGGYPNFKKKHDSRQSYRIVNQKDRIRIVGKYIKIPVLGYVRIKQTIAIDNINSITVEVTPSRRYYAVINTSFEPEVYDNHCKMIGIDLGLKEFLTDSGNNVVENPRWYRNSLKKLHREQRKLSHMIEGKITGYTKGKKGGRVPVYVKSLYDCKNIQKQNTKVAKLYEKTSNQRKDFQQKLSTNIVKENQLIGIEDLNIKGMMKNKRLAKSIGDAGWSKFIDMLEYKAIWYGSKIIKVPRFFSSSQLCNSCGFKNPQVKDLSIREWDCPQCGHHNLRDYNAAKNILQKAIEINNLAIEKI